MEKLYRLLYPMRVVLVTSKDGKKDNIMTAAWCFPLSMDPPMFGISIAKKRFSYELIHNSGEFAINIPGPELKEKALLCGRHSGRDTDKFQEFGLTRERPKEINAPLIKECNASIECRLTHEVETGDHVIFAGEAVNIVKRKEGKGLYHAGGDELIEI